MTPAATNAVAAGPDAPRTAASTTTPAASTPGTRGRNRITAKALNRIVAAVTADEFGVKPSRVGVDLADHKGLLVLTVTTPIRVVSLSRVHAATGAVERSGGSILDRASRAQEVIRDRVNELTGSAIGRVTVRLSAADIQNEERVR